MPSRGCASSAANVLFIVLLATLMVPFQVMMIPTFLIVKAPRA